MGDALAKLAKVTRRGPNDATARCPAHADRTPSLSVTRGKNGDAVFKCFAGCDWREISAELGGNGRGVSTPTRSAATRQRLSKIPGKQAAPSAPRSEEWTVVWRIPSDAPKEFPTHSLGQPSTTWTYRDEDGRKLFHVFRFDAPDGSKKILPLAFYAGPNGQRQWRWQLHPSPRPLYGLDRLAERPGVPILVTEGEKVADAAELCHVARILVAQGIIDSVTEYDNEQ